MSRTATVRNHAEDTGSLARHVQKVNTPMESKIDEVIFKMKDGREVKVSEYGGGWCQYNVTVDEMLDPQFVDELWYLLNECIRLDCLSCGRNHRDGFHVNRHLTPLLGANEFDVSVALFQSCTYLKHDNRCLKNNPARIFPNQWVTFFLSTMLLALHQPVKCVPVINQPI